MQAAIQVVATTPEPRVLRGASGPLPSLVFKPAGKARALVAYFHGGAFVAGDETTSATLAKALARDVTVVTPSYALAPARPFPAAIEDAHATLSALARDAKKARIPLIVAGDEAGGNLAAAAALVARDRHGPDLAAQILVSPMLDPCMCSQSMREGSPECIAGYADYLPRAQDRVHPYAAPLAASRLAGLPPTLLVAATLDPLRDDAERYAAALAKAGVQVQLARHAATAAEIAHPDHPGFDALVETLAGFIRRVA